MLPDDGAGLGGCVRPGWEEPLILQSSPLQRSRQSCFALNYSSTANQPCSLLLFRSWTVVDRFLGLPVLCCCFGDWLPPEKVGQ